MPRLNYKLVDVFTAEPLAGNALAVFTDSREVSAETMQKIAAEMNLAETTFILPSRDASCVARVRIFTPAKEMDFAGHPTIGTAAVLARTGAAGTEARRFFLEENIGKISIEIDPSTPQMVWLETPPIERVKAFDRAQSAVALGLHEEDLLDAEPEMLSAGNPTLFVALRSEEAVDRAFLTAAAMKDLRGSTAYPFCVFVFAPRTTGAYSRMFAPDYGIPEDPATGSSTGPLMFYMTQRGLFDGVTNKRFISEQGTKMRRRSFIHAQTDGERIFVGGHVTHVGEGTLTF